MKNDGYKLMTSILGTTYILIMGSKQGESVQLVGGNHMRTYQLYTDTQGRREGGLLKIIQ